MRNALALAVLLVLAVPAQAILLPALPVGAGAGGPGPQEAPAAPEAPAGPHVRIALRNTGQPRDLLLNVSGEGGGASVTREVSVGAPEEVVVHEPWPQAAFRVEVTEVRQGGVAVPREVPVQTATVPSLAADGDLRACDGAYLVEFELGPSGWRSWSRGCLAKPPGFDVLVAEVREGMRGAAGAGVAVPWPGDADEGYFEGPSGRVAFRWTPRERAVGPDGEPREGPALRWTGPGFRVGAAWAFQPVQALPAVGGSDDLVARDLPMLVRFEPGSVVPWAGTATIAGVASSAARPGAVQVGFVHELAFTPSDAGCLARNALQGEVLTPGGRIPASAFCGGVLAPGDAWAVGSPAEVRGFRAVPLLALEEAPDGRVTVARAWFGEGVPYPLRLELASHAPDQPSSLVRAELVGLRGAGEPLVASRAAEAAAPPPPPPATAPLDPLRGPALGEARARVPFPLDEAVDAALGDPLLRGLAGLRAREGAVLGAAQLDRRPLASRGAEELVWSLGFAAPGADQVWVVCTRPFEPGAGVAAPVARCEERAPDTRVTSAVAIDPRASAAALPPAAAPWDAAIARWDQHDPDASTVTFARYVPFGDWRWFAPGPRLDLGRHFPLPGALGGLPALAEASFVGTDLGTGRAALVGTGTARDSGLGVVPAFIAPRPAIAGAGPRGPGVDAPVLVGATAAGLLLLALGGLLYTRLSRPKLLDQEARAKVYAMVATEPGLHASEVARRLGGGHGLAEYHLGVLVREGYLTTVATPGFRRYFVTGRLPPAAMRAQATLAQGRAADALRAIAARPGLSLSDLAAALGVQAPAASKVVDRLEAAGLVERRRDGRAVRLFPAAPPAGAPGSAAAEA